MVDRMPPCVDCDRLLDQPSTTEPHDALNGGAVYSALSAVLERYSCSTCGTVWDRWRAERADASYRWARLIARDYHERQS